MSKSEELELAKEVARKAKVLAQERQDKMLATVRAEFYVQLSEVLKAGVVKAATWHVGENTPPSDFGRAGDLYLDITTADVLFNNAGSWEVVLNVRPKDGIDGKDGAKGDTGERGATGLAGERGKAGRDGKDGKDGKNGRDGVDGARGRDGKDGRDGSRWFSEKGKPNYSLGKKNDFYLDATTGDFYTKESDISWVKKGSLKPDNVTGGFIVSGGTGGGGSGTDGREVELQANATHIQWRYVGSATWTDLVLLEDLKGDTGATGAQGIQGIQGIQGVKGDKGDTGDTGPTGPAGANGADGADGQNAVISQTVIDFGNIPISDKLFNIVDASITLTSKIMATVAWVSTLNRDADELMADSINISVQPKAGSMDIYAGANVGVVSGKYGINYTVTN